MSKPINIPGARSLAVPTRWFSRAALIDPDGLVTTRATVTTVDLIDQAAEFNGVEGALLFGNKGPARTVSVTSAAVVGAYNAVGIVIAGWFAGVAVTETLTLTATGGGETINGTQPFDHIETITIPAMADTDGSFTFGVRDIVAPGGGCFRYVRANAAGSLLLRFEEDSALDDTRLALAGEVVPCACTRVLAATSIAVSVGF